ncbi:Crp/Fnr family transcriptional regulator [Cellulophaga sp. 20_2_10]|uniref:Crp/Fnr family transcriptional regulator n=1 Tax=Cellulophaga sp. 20_2_10 TaxID=2942476 RepID=UPI00201AF749|nr:Crp/Fnr family transcriptional regulator [Cellulophaga sp. 20_2_10]MCL5245232.1 Crp/Fnr family transcriptional regulator [Cellulophaga sp. 20_2_10]
MTIDTILNKVYTLPLASLIKIKDNVVEVSYPKMHIIIKDTTVEPNIYFIKSGIVRAYSDYDTTEVTFWFGKESEAIISMRSYIENKKGYEHIELLEDCVLYKLKTNTLKQLFLTDIHIANWGRKFAEQELIKTEERLISRQFRTATERYQDLLENNGDLIRRVQLGHIASYLGITQVSLSRIRAAIK